MRMQVIFVRRRTYASPPFFYRIENTVFISCYKDLANIDTVPLCNVGIPSIKFLSSVYTFLSTQELALSRKRDSGWHDSGLPGFRLDGFRMSEGRILVVDNEPQIRRVMRTTLISEGFEVDDAKTGEEALDHMRSGKYDLALLDINMPGMTGFEVCRAIRAASEMPIIMLTVRSGEKDKVAALDAGADDYITKPFSTPELLARVRAALRRSPFLTISHAQLHLGPTEIDFEARQVREPLNKHWF